MSLVGIYTEKDATQEATVNAKLDFVIGCIKREEQEIIKGDLTRRLNELPVQYDFIGRPNKLEMLVFKGGKFINSVNSYMTDGEDRMQDNQEISIYFYFNGIVMNGDTFLVLNIATDTLNREQRKAFKKYLLDNVFMYIPYN